MTAAFRHDVRGPARLRRRAAGRSVRPEAGGRSVARPDVLRGILRVLAVHCGLCHATNLNKLSAGRAHDTVRPRMTFHMTPPV